KAHRLVTKCREDLLMPQQPLAVHLDDQYRLAAPAPRWAVRRLTRCQFDGQGARKPYVEAGSSPKAALHAHRSAMLPDDLAHRRQAEPVSSASRGEERLEDSFPRGLVHPAA